MAAESVRVAEVGLDNTVIRAPFGGVVVNKAAQPGEMISPISAGGGFTRTGIGTIVDMDSLEIEVDVNESFIDRVTAGQPVEATLERLPRLEDPRVRSSPSSPPPTAEGHREGAHRHRVEGRAHRARHGRAGGLPGCASRPPAGRRGPVSWSPPRRCAARAARRAVFVHANDRVERRGVTLGQTAGAERRGAHRAPGR